MWNEAFLTVDPFATLFSKVSQLFAIEFQGLTSVIKTHLKKKNEKEKKCR